MRALILAACCVAFAGCGRGGPAPVDVKGAITLDGKPLPDGKVYFVSTTGTAPTVAEVAAGAFSLRAVPGSYRVEVRALKERIPWPGEPHDKMINYIPGRFNTESMLKAEVRAGAANEFAFQIQSR